MGVDEAIRRGHARDGLSIRELTKRHEVERRAVRWQRLVAEHGAVVSERQVCRHVRDRRRELGVLGEAFMPLVAEAGVEAGSTGPGDSRAARPGAGGACVS